jgi:hypothetical protein
MHANAWNLHGSRARSTQHALRRKTRCLRRETQGGHGGVREDVSASELPGSRAQSAVFLVHAESPRQAPGGQVQERAAGRLALRKGMLSHGKCERHVMGATYQRRTGRRLEKSSVHGRNEELGACEECALISGWAKKAELSEISIQVAVNSFRASLA